MTTIGQLVTVGGTKYKVLAAGPVGTGKFFGRRRWLLKNPDGTHVECHGKAVAHNSKISPAGKLFWKAQGVDL
jgi:hypothetical protein